jgi:DNA-binding NtrC family response regulator
MIRVLLLDPNASRRDWFGGALSAAGLSLIPLSDWDDPLNMGLDRIDVVVSFAELGSGNPIMQRSRLGGLPLIICAENASVRHAVKAMQLGAADYLEGPFELGELIEAIHRCFASVPSRASRSYPRSGLAPLVGHCASMRLLVERIEATAKEHGPVLIQGESGSGKELVARTLHAVGDRRTRPLTCFNCATIPPELIQFELFGDENGDADLSGGIIEACNGSSLFLDEISALPLDSQARLLRLVGSCDDSDANAGQGAAADVRLITSTHRDLGPLVAQGRFLAELYGCLSATTLAVPPLRERGDDIVEIANWLLHEICRKLSKPALSLSDAALQAICHYDWPGNVRELENALERAVILCDHDPIDAPLLGIDSPVAYRSAAPLIQDEHSGGTTLEGYFVKFVLEHQDALTETELANKLGISRKSLWERRQRLDIPRKRTRTRAPRRDSGK